MCKMSFVDLNADVGESFGAYHYGADYELLPLITSANIACGWHGGDPCTMRRAVALACRHGVRIGAHPGYPDLLGFGRRPMGMSSQEVTDSLLYQIGALDGICRAHGTKVSYIKPHGALYNETARSMELASAVVLAVKEYDPSLYLLCPAGSALAQAADAHGISAVREFFADRGYLDDGSLAPRGTPGAVITDPELVSRRVLRGVRAGILETVSGKELPVQFDSICLHGDTPAAVTLAQHIRSALLEAHVELRAFSEDGCDGF